MIEQTPCEATGKPHTTVLQQGSLYCLDCRKKIESCCEGEAGNDSIWGEVKPGYTFTPEQLGSSRNRLDGFMDTNYEGTK